MTIDIYLYQVHTIRTTIYFMILNDILICKMRYSYSELKMIMSNNVLELQYLDLIVRIGAELIHLGEIMLND